MPIARRILRLLACAAPLAGCMMPPTPMMRAQEATQEFNLDLRFGRAESALEKVAPAARNDYAEHHRAWGSNVRIAELEVAGMHPKNDHDVDVIVNVEWYRPENQDLRTTTLKQSWHDQNGWQLVAETRTGGDVGLLGEQVVVERPAEPSAPAQFPTVRIGGATD